METRVALIGIIVEQESSAAALNALLHFARSRRIPLVLCSTVSISSGAWACRTGNGA